MEHLGSGPVTWAKGTQRQAMTKSQTEESTHVHPKVPALLGRGPGSVLGFANGEARQ